jgi:translation initiation factor IF-3
VVCIFRGRQRAHPEMGAKVMERVARELADISKIESPPRMNGPRMTMLLARRSGQPGEKPPPPPVFRVRVAPVEDEAGDGADPSPDEAEA